MPRRQLLHLLDACKAEPHDDTVRLAVADWLEESGDEADRARAEFVRFQLDAAAETGGTEYLFWPQSRWKDRAAEWLPFVCEPVASQSFRGLIHARLDRAAARKPGAAAVADSESWAWVERLTVPTRGKSLPELLASPLLDNVPTIDFFGPLSDLQTKRLAASIRPAWRDLSVWPEGKKGLTILLKGNVAGLRGLSLAPCADAHVIGDGAALPALEHVSLPAREEFEPWTSLLRRASWRLRSLALPYSPAAAVVRAAAEADSCAGITSLRISSRSTRLPLRGARFWPTLEELDMSDGGFPARGLDGLAEADAPRLRRLSLGASTFAPDELRRLAASPALSALDRLNLSGSLLGPEGATALTAMSASPLLLNLSRCRIGDDGLKALAAWPGLARCRELWLTANEITDVGLRALVDSPHVKNLAGLVLYANAITNEGASRLFAADWARRLRMLSLGDNRITDAVAPALHHLRGGEMKELGLGITLPARTRDALAAVAYID